MSWLFNIFDLFLSPWIRIPNPDPDPEDPLNPDPIWTRIQNTGKIWIEVCLKEVLPTLTYAQIEMLRPEQEQL